MESQEIDLSNYGKLTYAKGDISISGEKNNWFNKNVGISCLPSRRKLKLYYYLSSHVKINPKDVTNLNIKSRKFLEEKLREDRGKQYLLKWVFIFTVNYPKARYMYLNIHTYEPGKKYGRLYDKMLTLVSGSGVRWSIGVRRKGRDRWVHRKIEDKGKVFRPFLKGMYNMNPLI